MTSESTLDDLYSQVTAAILSAESTADDIGAAEAYLDVSWIEEEIAERCSAASPEGQIARRGAVRAALRANQYTRALDLAERYLSDTAIALPLEVALRSLRKIAEAAIDEVADIAVEVTSARVAIESPTNPPPM